MSDVQSVITTKKSYRERKTEQRTEERTIKLIYRLARALMATRDIAQQHGVNFDEQAVCNKALHEFAKWEQQAKPPSYA